MTSDVSCPCGMAIKGIVADSVSAEQAILAAEHAVFQVLAAGAQFYVRWHDISHTPAEAVGEVYGIVRRLRIALASLEQHLVDCPPEREPAGAAAGVLRSWGRSFGQIAAHLYREAARVEAVEPAAEVTDSAESPFTGTGTVQ